jgi:Tol biopolymer transport system component
MATSVIFVDSRVADLASVVSGGYGDRDCYILSPDEDGVATMRRILAGYSDLEAIHVVSHGSEGALVLGSTRLDAAGLSSHAADLAGIGASLSATGDLLLYGCDVARGDAGLAFVEELARLTGAAVAASSNATGAAALGGDWRLEVASGPIEAITLDGQGFGGLLAGATVSIAASWTYRAEGFTGSVPFTFVVTRTGDASTTESVDWAVTGAGPNPAMADDFAGGALPAGTVTFAPGETSKTVTVAVQANSAAEPEEGFTVGLSNASAGLMIDRATASATIIDEVGTRFVVSIDPVALLSNDSTLSPIFSPDGLKVAFQGFADNLVPGDTNDDPDFFVKDLVTGAIVRVSTDSAGNQALGDVDNNSDQIRFSPDSTKVIFGSRATNLVAGDTNGKQDIFVKDLTTGEITRVSTDAAGAQADDESHQPMFSPDGTKVVFWSSATNLVAGDTNGKADIFIKVLATGGITRVSTDSTGVESNDQSTQPVFSPDGTRVAFISKATNLVAGDTNGQTDIFIKDLVSGETTRVSTSSTGEQAGRSSSNPVFSPDGTRLLFSSSATNLVAGDTNSADDIFVKDLITGAVTRFSTDAAGGQANGGSSGPAFSPDGMRVSFSSSATNLVTGDTNGKPDIFVKDLTTGAIQRVSTSSGGVQADNFSFESNFSPDGTRLIISSEASNLVTGDTNGVVDAFIAALNLVSVTATNAVRSEGPSGATLFSFTVSRTGVITQPLSVEWSVAGTGLHPADAADFGGVLPSGMVFLAGSEPSTVVTVTVAGDAAIELDETFGITLANPSVTDFMLGTRTATGIIQNDDKPVAAIAADAATHAEGNAGMTTFTFTVTLDRAGPFAETVDWAVTGSGANPADAADFGGVMPSGTVTFGVGETTKTVTVNVAGETFVELDEGFTVALSNPSSGLSVGAGSASSTILNDDAVVGIRAASATRMEGSAGTTAFTFTVAQVGDLSVSHSVVFAVVGSGTNPADASDFVGGVLPSGTVTFAAGETSKTVTVAVAGDATVEANEGFSVVLSNPSAGLSVFSGDLSSASGTIQNDDGAVSIAALSAAKAEENSGTIPFTFTVSLGQAGLTVQTVDWTVVGTGDQPADGADFVGGTLPSGTVTFAAGEISKTITLPVSGDTAVEVDEFFAVTLSNPSPGLSLGTASALGIIQNDDRATISIAPLAASKAEGDGGTTAFTFTVRLDQASFAEQVADWTVTGSGGNPANAADFGGAFPSGKVTFAAGETSKVVTILVSGDTAAEFNEDFAVTLSNPTFGLLIGTASATGTILNDDKSVVSVTAGPGSRAEGTGGTKTFDWTVSLDRAGVTSQMVAWAVSGSGVHAADGADLLGGVLPAGTLTFAAGETTKTVTIDVASDSAVEFDEGLVLTLSAPSSGLDLGTASMAGTIVNDDLSVVSIAVQSASKAEGNSGTTAFTFTVGLSQAGVTSQTVDWKVTGSGASAADAADFGGALPAGTVTFAAGETSKVVTIQVSGDTVAESNETFLVSLLGASAGLEIGTSSAGGTILDDDGSVSIAALSAAKAEGTGGTTAFSFTVTTTGDSSATRTVAWGVTGSGTNKADATDFAGGSLPSGILTFAPGETSKELTINVVADASPELDEGFQVSLSNPSSNLKIGAGSASGTIQNDDIALTVTTHDDAYIVLEGQSLAIAASAGVLLNDQNASSAAPLGGTSHGTLQLAGTGSFSYTPTPSFTGIDAFTYHAVPGGSGVDGKAQIYVVPVNVGASTTLDLLGLSADEQIAATYVAFFGRAADAAGHAFWVGEFNRGLPTQGPAALFANIASSFGISAEAKALYPFLVSPFEASDAQISSFLDSVYNNLFNRSSDAGGLAYWTGEIKATLQAGQFVGSVLVNIMSGAQDTVDGKDITTLMGKVAVSLEYVHEQDAHHTAWNGASDIAAATNLLRTVAGDSASVLIGVKNAETLIASHG